MLHVDTTEISVDEWKYKVSHESDEWLIRQYRGLCILLDSMDKEIQDTYHRLKREKGTMIDDVYKEVIYPMENDYMDVDIQFVNVEDELDNRGISVLM